MELQAVRKARYETHGTRRFDAQQKKGLHGRP
jgi:hypothetical protein